MANPGTKVKAPVEKQILSRNGTAQKQPQEAANELDKLLIANITFVVWLIFLAIGGGILALYYARIGYLPDIEWKTLLIYLFIGSMVGGTLGLLLTISLFTPGFLWSEFILFDKNLEKHFSYDMERDELCIRGVITCLGLPFLFVLLISHLALLAGSALAYGASALGLLVITFYLMRLRFKYILVSLHEAERRSKRKIIAKRRKTGGILKYLWSNLGRTVSNVKRTLKRQARRHGGWDQQTFKYSFWFTLTILLSLVSMYIIFRLSGSPPFSRRFIALTLLCATGVWISNHVVAMRYRHYPRQAIFASLIAAGLLLFMADNFSSLSTKLMGYYGFAGKYKFDLLVNKEGAEIIDGLKLTDCKCPSLSNVEILSKVGNEYYLKANGRTFTIPKSYVVSFSLPDQSHSKDNPFPAVTAR
jgi:hypothetical protein